MPWDTFFTITAQVIIGLILGIVVAALVLAIVKEARKR